MMFFRNKREERNTQGRPLSYSRGALEAVEAGARMVWRHRVLTALLLVVCVFAVEFTLLKMPQAQAAYTISNSARFISGNSAYLNKTFSGDGTRTKWTFSAWVKRGSLGSIQAIFGARAGSPNEADSMELKFNSSDGLTIGYGNADWKVSSAVFRDPAAWYHIVAAFDSTQTSGTNRIRLYVNGVELTSFSTNTSPTQNLSSAVTRATEHRVGSYASASPDYFDGYIADSYLIDGEQLDPASFGAYDANGYWRPISYTGTYGTNGFLLAFGNSAALGTDTSGNSNTWTVNGLTSVDQVIDTPTNTYWTLSTLFPNTLGTVANGNLEHTAGTVVAHKSAAAPALPKSGKWYWEVTANNNNGGSGNNMAIGVADVTINPQLPASGTEIGGRTGADYIYRSSGAYYTNNASSGSPATYTTGDTISVAWDADNGKIFFAKNGTWQSSGDPAAGTNPAFSSIAIATGTWAPADSDAETSYVKYYFGQGASTTMSYDSAAGGYFKYTPPSGFKALSTSNLPEPAVAVPKNYFDAVLYAGTGATQTVAAGSQVVPFTSSGTWTAPAGVTSVNYLVVGGGGGGGYNYGGGGGSGGFRTGVLSVTPGASLTVTVGAGGAGASTDAYGINGADSVFGSITSVGGGGGGSRDTHKNGVVGGSGGGGSNDSGVGAAGTSGQGSAGGSNTNGGVQNNAGGGGGANAVGGNGSGEITTSGKSGDGGAGKASPISGTSVTYAGGGGGGGYSGNGTSHGVGGAGGGGNGADSAAAVAGTANTGGGGGGGNGTSAGAAGGSGIVIISYQPAGIGFQPDLVWIKDRTSALMHNIFDSARLVYPYWSSNASTVETGGASTTLTAFLSNGFTLGTNALFNTSGNNYVSWLWKESSTSGVDVVTYTGDNTSNRAISHSLGVAPDFVIVKRRDAAGDPYVWHNKLTGAAYFLKADSNTFTQTNTNTPWGTGGWTSSTFMVTNNSTNNANASGGTYVSYLFASTTGFSDFGSYTGNGSDDGPFIYTGFKPKYVMIHDPNNDNLGFSIWDTARESYNPMGKLMAFYDTSAEPAFASLRAIDILSNGFKIRTSAGGLNTSSRLFIYAAFAEIPFQQSAQPYNLTIASSTRFIPANTTKLKRTPAGAGNQKTYTLSAWVKPSDTADTRTLMGVTDLSGGNQQTYISFGSSKFSWFFYDGGTQYNVDTAALFRDPAVWMHVVARVDTTQATAANRVRLYINGVQQTTTGTQPTQNLDTFLNKAISTGVGVVAGTSYSDSYYYDGYMSDVYFIDGQALTPTDFGEYDTSGYWRPKTYSGTYGTNGFHLPLMGTSTAAGIGIDTSGNSNTWTVSGIATTDFVTDSPTNSFATWSPINVGTNYGLLAGNLQSSNTGNNTGVLSSAAIPSGSKVYFEYTNNVVGTCANGFENYIGITKTNVFPDLSSASRGDCGTSANSYCYLSYPNAGNLARNNGVYSAYGNTWCTPGDVVGVAVDLVNNKIWFAKNGTWQNSGDPVAGTNAAFTVAAGDYFAHNGYGGTVTAAQLKGTVNFGQGGQTCTNGTLTYDSASGGYFCYTPPSGFKALSTANLPTPSVTIPKNYFDAVTYTGTGAAKDIKTNIVSFTTTGTTTWQVPTGVTSVTYLVVGGGGAGGTRTGGGGGAGGYRTGTLSVTTSSVLTVVVGAGGATVVDGVAGNPGTQSVFDSITSSGGGAGGTDFSPYIAGNGGSGGGATDGAGNAHAGGTGNAGGYSPSEGNNGGTNNNITDYGAGGGGGASAVGGNGSVGVGGAGGAGTSNSISGAAVTYAGGGGGSGGDGGGGDSGGAGGAGGGGAGATGTSNGTAGTANTGGGGGGARNQGGGGGNGGAGGSGIVIVSYTASASTPGFTPDIVWLKDRTSANAHGIFASSTPLYPALASNAVTAEGGAGGTALSSFLSNGFSLGASSTVNTSGNNYVSWLWKKSATSGMDIVTYTGTGAAQTIAHSLGVAPDFIIVKRRDAAGDPAVYHSSNTSAPATDYLLLDSTAATADDDTYWNDTKPTTSVFSVKSNTNTNSSGATYVAYLFASTTGFSNFGTYTGNGSADGPFVYTGFKPRYVLLKRTDSTTDWRAFDTARDTYNPSVTRTTPSQVDADSTNATFADFLSNGFKLRGTDTNWNASGGTYIYAAFAEQPFKYSAASASSAASTFVQAVAFLMGMTF